MNFKRILGMIIFIGGATMLAFSFYIKSQVEEGKVQISDAQHKVDQGNSLFSGNPIAKQIGKAAITDPAQKKINAGKAEVVQYEQVAEWMQIGGIVFMVVGLGLLIFGRKSRKNPS